MVTKVQKWGNSHGLRLTRQVLQDAHLSLGDAVDVAVEEGAIVIRPLAHVRGRYTLRQLLAAIPKDYRAEEVDWGNPVGKEVW